MNYKVARLSNDHLTLAVVPDFGARVTELIDKRSGRNWLVPGSLDVDTGNEAVYGRGHATGWDECFPTVAPCDATDLVWTKRLRDHGALWGRPWTCTFSDNSVLAIRSTVHYKFQRRIILNENRIQIDYKLQNRMSVPMPWLWSQHCLLNTSSSDSIALSGIGQCTSSYLIQRGKFHQKTDFAWPDLGSEFHCLSQIKECDAQFALKAYAPVDGDFRAVIGDWQGQISCAFSSSTMPFVGLWLAYGGWPNGDGVHQIAIEPTNAPANDLRSAVDANHNVMLAAGSNRYWSVSLSLLNQCGTSTVNSSMA